MKIILKNTCFPCHPASTLVRALLLFAALVCAPALRAQTVEMQDKFTYTAPNISDHAPTLSSGTSVWTTFANGTNSIISANGSEAVIRGGDGTPGSGWVVAYYPLTPAANTIYTLTVVFSFLSPSGPRDCWAGMGFSNQSKGGANNQNKAPWMLIRPQKTAAENPQACGNIGLTKTGGSNVSASDYAGPIVVSIKWNTSNGQAQFFINGELQSSWSTSTATPSGQHYIFFEGFQTGSTVNAKSVTLTAEALNK